MLLVSQDIRLPTSVMFDDLTQCRQTNPLGHPPTEEQTNRTSQTVRCYLKKTNIGINGNVVVGELEWRTVPVVADSRSEELTDGQETPFLPPSAANRPAGMSYKSCVGS